MSAPVPWSCDPAASFGERVAQVAASVLADGILSQSKRTAIYSAFIACGGGERLETVKTSCAVFAGAVLHWAGRPAMLPRYPTSGATSISSWLAGLSFASRSWKKFGDAACVPQPGAIFYVQSASNPNNNHVGVLLREIIPGVWLTAEGGRGDGTECWFTVRRWGPKWDARELRGLWLPEEMDRLGGPPAPGAPPPQPKPAFPIVRGDKRKAVVTQWQERLLARDPACLPRFGADGGWGDETSAATAAVQKAANLALRPDVCDAATWDAAKS